MMRRKSLVYGTLAAVTVALFWAYETYVGFPRYVEEHWVYRVNVPHTYEWYPIPQVKGEFFFAYTDRKHARVRHGAFWDYLENGQLSTTGYYLDGEPHGTWRHYDANGEVEGEALFDRGTLVRESNFFRPKR